MSEGVRVPILRKREIADYALVDPEDAEWALSRRWRFYGGGTGTPYVASYVRADDAYLLMHRAILGLPRGSRLQADHRNGNRLDNRRANLRVVTQALNAQNQRSYPNTSSRFRGVAWDAQKRKWRAQAKLRGHNHYLGRYDDEEEAARVVSEWRSRNMPGSIEAPAT